MPHHDTASEQEQRHVSHLLFMEFAALQAASARATSRTFVNAVVFVTNLAKLSQTLHVSKVLCVDEVSLTESGHEFHGALHEKLSWTALNSSSSIHSYVHSVHCVKGK